MHSYGDRRIARARIQDAAAAAGERCKRTRPPIAGNRGSNQARGQNVRHRYGTAVRGYGSGQVAHRDRVRSPILPLREITRVSIQYAQTWNWGSSANAQKVEREIWIRNEPGDR